MSADEPRPEEPEGPPRAPPSPARRAARSARARTRTSRPACRATRVMAGIVVDHARGQRRHRRRRQHLPRLHRRHRRQRARPLAPDVRRRRSRSRSARASVGSFTSRGARRARRAARRARRRRRASTALQLYSGGAEAVESALRLAKCHTGKYEFVSFWGGFHGKTMGALSLMGSTFKDKLGPDGAGRAPRPVRRLLPLPARARVPVLRPRLRRGRAQAASRSPTAGAVAAVIVEPMQGTAGNIIPPNEFLPAVRVDRRRDRRAVHRRRDDHRLRPHRHAAGASTTPASRPDIVTIGKAFGGGFPLSGAAHHRRDRAAPSRGRNPSGSSSSYGGNPLGAAAGAAALRDHRRGAASSRTRATSAPRMLARAASPSSTLPVRRPRATARGLFLGVELVQRQEDEGAAAAQGRPRAIFNECVRARPADDGLRAELPHPAGAHHRRGDRAERRRHPARGLRSRRSARGSGRRRDARALAPHAGALARAGRSCRRCRSSVYGLVHDRHGRLRWDHVGDDRSSSPCSRTRTRGRRSSSSALYPHRRSSASSTTRCATSRTSASSPERVHVCDLRAHRDVALRRHGRAASAITLDDWFLTHHCDRGSTSTAPSPTARSSSSASARAVFLYFRDYARGAALRLGVLPHERRRRSSRTTSTRRRRPGTTTRTAARST